MMHELKAQWYIYTPNFVILKNYEFCRTVYVSLPCKFQNKHRLFIPRTLIDRYF